MKNLLKTTLSLLLVASLIPVTVYSEEKTESGKSTTTEGENGKSSATVEFIDTPLDKFMQGCSELRNNEDWESLITSVKSGANAAAEFDTVLKSRYDEMKTTEGSTTEKLQAEMTKLVTQATKCVAFAHVVAGRDLAETEAPRKARRKVSGDKAIKCYNYEIYSMDYDACSAMIDAYDMATVAEYGMQAFQKIDYQSTTSDAQQDYMNDVSNPVGALEAQKKGIKKQAQIANTQAAMHSAKVAAVWYHYDKMPSLEELLNSCTTTISNSSATISSWNTAFEGITIEATGPTDPAYLCKNILASKINFLPNTSAKDQAKRVMAKDAANAVVKVAEGALLNKQAGKLKGAIDNVNKFDPSELGFTNDNVDPCLQDPNAEGCLGSTKESVDFADSGFIVDGGWGGSNSSNGTTDRGEDYDPTTGLGDPSSGDPTRSMGSVIADNSTAGGFAGTPPSAASVKSSGGATTGSGGGGGGGAGSASAPGGSGGSGGRGAMPSSEKQAKIAYSGGTSGIGYAGGRGSKATTAKKSSNPFGSLFNKDKKAAEGNGVLNFRGLASQSQIGSKNGRGLFEMISTRYQAVNKADKLLKYETVENK